MIRKNARAGNNFFEARMWLALLLLALPVLARRHMKDTIRAPSTSLLARWPDARISVGRG